MNSSISRHYSLLELSKLILVVEMQTHTECQIEGVKDSCLISREITKRTVEERGHDKGVDDTGPTPKESAKCRSRANRHETAFRWCSLPQIYE